MKKIGLFLVTFFMLNFAYATSLEINYEIGDTLKPKKVRIEKKIINGVETTKIWVNGEEVKVGTSEYKKELESINTETVGTTKEKRRIIIKEIEDNEMEFDDVAVEDIERIDVKKTKTGKKIFIQKKNGEVIEKSMNGKEDVEVNIDVEVESTENGERIIIKENGEVVEEVIVDENGKNEIKVITENEATEIIIIKDEKGKTKKQKRKSKSKNKAKNKEIRVIVKEVESEEVEEIIIDNHKK